MWLNLSRHWIAPKLILLATADVTLLDLKTFLKQKRVSTKILSEWINFKYDNLTWEHKL